MSLLLPRKAAGPEGSCLTGLVPDKSSVTQTEYAPG